MNAKKRQRLDLGLDIDATTGGGAGAPKATAAPTTTTTTTTTATTASDLSDALLASSFGNGQSLFLTSTGNGSGGAQILLTICGDENSDESQEYYAIKQEPDMDLNSLLPSNLQLPTGCEIYLVKDTTISSPMQLNGHTHTHTQTQTTHIQAQTIPPKATIKLEPDSMSDRCGLTVNKLCTSSTNILYVSNGASDGKPSTNATATPERASGTPKPAVAATIAKVAAAAAAAPTTAATTTNTMRALKLIEEHVGGGGGGGGAGGAGSTASAVGTTMSGTATSKLDAYKKRDDKRRATHNEVERRRRDKINCWIFKLKEMLPIEGSRYRPPPPSNGQMEPVSISLSSSTSEASTSPGLRVNQSANGRTPPNDSKSQILIKACEYIKSMQGEIDNLREGLREADKLRVTNKTLRDELNSLKRQQELQERFHSNGGGSFNVTLNSLNSSATSDLFDGIDGPHHGMGMSMGMGMGAFGKRGLMIADYDE
ncbi:mucin-19 [Drosophila obscura]|uniref:mucin-19 n=1 Tax=Drosophila obscura TaxID=7282 RepID=UPI001BB2485A|nr:mucin-19 [Drosophila obscura]